MKLALNTPGKNVGRALCLFSGWKTELNSKKAGKAIILKLLLLSVNNWKSGNGPTAQPELERFKSIAAQKCRKCFDHVDSKSIPPEIGIFRSLLPENGSTFNVMVSKTLSQFLLSRVHIGLLPRTRNRQPPQRQHSRTHCHHSCLPHVIQPPLREYPPKRAGTILNCSPSSKKSCLVGYVNMGSVLLLQTWPQNFTFEATHLDPGTS